MDIYSVIGIAIGLAMDALAVSICKGLALVKPKVKEMLWVGLWFGIFQGLMPLFGYFLGTFFSSWIEAIDHWVAFVLLSWIGINMIRESMKNETIDNDLSIKTMLLLAIATSIDALAIGITFAFLKVNIINSSLLIGIITFVLSSIGVLLGSKVGSKISKSGLFGGIILIFIGIKILIEHLFFQ